MRGPSQHRRRGATSDGRQAWPAPRPGVLDIAPYVPGTSALPGAHPVIKLSSNETPFGPSPARDRGLSRSRRHAVALPRRLGAAFARSDRQALRARSRPDRLRRGLRRAAQPPGAAPISGPATRRSTASTASSFTRSRSWRAGATPVAAPETDLTTDVDAILARVTPAHAHRVHRQSEQPDRHLSPLRRGEAPARRLARRRAARARRGLCRICAEERLRGRHRARRHHAQHGDDAHLLQDLRARLAPARLGLLPDRRSPMR